jgi:hypothetical protein
MLPKVGHGYSVEKNWVPQFEAAYDRLTAPPREPAARYAVPNSRSILATASRIFGRN